MWVVPGWAKRMFRHTFIVTWMNNTINVHLAVEKGLFWGNTRKEGYSVLVGKQVIVLTLVTLIGVPTLLELVFRVSELEPLHNIKVTR